MANAKDYMTSQTPKEQTTPRAVSNPRAKVMKNLASSKERQQLEFLSNYNTSQTLRGLEDIEAKDIQKIDSRLTTART